MLFMDNTGDSSRNLKYVQFRVLHGLAKSKETSQKKSYILTKISDGRGKPVSVSPGTVHYTMRLALIRYKNTKLVGPGTVHYTMKLALMR